MKNLGFVLVSTVGALAAAFQSGTEGDGAGRPDVLPRAPSAAPAPAGGLTPLGQALGLSLALDAGTAARTPEGWALLGRGYRAELDLDGLVYAPLVSAAPGAPRPYLALAPSALEVGGRTWELVPSGPPVQPGGSFGGALVTPYADADLYQLCTPRADGVELELLLTRRPAAAGDLRVRFALEASLARLTVETSAGTFEELEPGGVGSVLVGRALAVDAAGATTGLAMTLEPDALVIELPAALLDAAAFPLLVDPLISTQAGVSTSPTTLDVKPDVAFDPVSGQFLVAWERPNGTDVSDVWAARVDPAGTLAAGPFLIDGSVASRAARPRVAVDPVTGNWLIAYEWNATVGGTRTVRWKLLDSANAAVATNEFTVAGYLGDVAPDVGFVTGPAGASGFVLASQRNGLTSPDATVQVTWIDAATAAVIDSQGVIPGTTPRDRVPAVPQLADPGPTLVAFQRFDVGDLDIQSACVTLGGGSVTLGAVLNVSDASGADANPDVASVAGGPFQVVWEHLVTSGTNIDIQGREVLSDCSGTAGATATVTSLALLETDPAAVLGLYNGPCDGQAVVLFTGTGSPQGSLPSSVLSTRWSSSTGALGALETLVKGSATLGTFASPAAALESTVTAQPRFLVVYDDYGSAATGSTGDVFAQVYTFDQVPAAVVVSPLNAAKCLGLSQTFTAGVTGTGPFTYQWRKDGAPISGATGQQYTIGAVAQADAGAYDVVVTGTCASITSQPSTLIVSELPTGVSIVGASAGCQGTTFTLDAVVQGGAGQVLYQWFKDNVAIPGANAATLTIPALQAGDAGAYKVTVGNSCGSLSSAPHPVSVLSGPPAGVTISAVPSVCEGLAVTLDAQVASGTGPFVHQWSKDGAPISGAINASYAIAAAAASDAGTYTVAVSNACGTATSPGHVLDVPQPPGSVAVVAPPSGCPGAAVTFQASAAGTAPFTYQWRKDGAPIAGATGASLTLAAVQAGDAGQYSVEVSNVCDSAASPDHAFSVDTPVAGVSLALAPTTPCAGNTVTLTANVTSGTPVSYEWFKDGLSLATTATGVYVIDPVATADIGSYSVLVGNACNAELSNAVALDLLDVPLVAVLDADAATVTLSWPWSSPACAAVSDFRVWRTDLVAGGVPELVGFVPQDGSPCFTFVDDGSGAVPPSPPLPGVAYAYVVEANNGGANPQAAPVLVQSSAAAASGDVDGNGRIDGRDLIAAALAQGACQGGPRWNPSANTVATATCAAPPPSVCGLAGSPEQIDADDLQVVLDAFGHLVPVP